MNARRTPFRGGCNVAYLLQLAFALVVSQHAGPLCHAAGTVSAWGDNSALQCQVPGNLSNVVAVAGGESHSLALRNDGTVAAWGFYTSGQTNVPVGLNGVAAISAGTTFSLALKSNGTVVVWGTFSATPAGLANVKAIAAGWNHALALRNDGTVIGWGNNTFGQTNVPPGLANVTAIAAGSGDSLALLGDGTVVAWGDSAYGKTTIPAGLSNVTAIAAGQDHCLALKSDGSVVAWGNNLQGQATIPANVTNVAAIAAGAMHSVALKQDSTLVAWGDNRFNQTTFTPTTNGFIALSAGAYHALAVRGDGSPVILGQPASQSVIISKNAVFQVMAAGALPLAYQWRHNGTNIAAATSTLLAVINVQVSDGGSYSVVVTNIFGSVTSAFAILTPVPSAPWITAQPQDQSILCGDGASFQVTVDGPPPYSCQWLFQAAPLPGALQSSLILSNVSPAQAGAYFVVVTNIYGSVTSTVANLAVSVDGGLITSALTASPRQGQAFTYTITAHHSPILFGASNLPLGLSVDPATGIISGIPIDSGTFGSTIFAANVCTSQTQILIFNIASSVPVITSSLTKTGTEGVALSYTIRASNTPTNYSASSLPLGLTVNATNGIISGTPVYPGDYYSPISASNVWGVGSALLHFSISNAPVTGLSIADVTTNYSSPYLVEFQFTLRNNNNPTNGTPIAAAPQLISASCFENDVALSPETGFFLGSSIQTMISKTYLVLDFTESIASLANGDSNGDGISDAVDNVVSGAQLFVNQQPPDAQNGVYEFHRDDQDPQRVIGLTTDKTAVNAAIGGIWTNYVQNFPAGSRCWDAVYFAITNLGPQKPGEQHNIVFVSDGADESSYKTAADVITAATNNGVKIYCVGFGSFLNPVALQAVTSATGGSYYTATNAAALSAQFAQISKEFEAFYILRWATLKRSATPFQPGFQVTYQGRTAALITNTITPAQTNIDDTTTPPTTNVIPAVTNILIPAYVPTQHTGTVTRGMLNMVANAQDAPKSVTLHSSYIPRYIRQLQLHYRPNWPCTASLQSTNVGELLYGWSLTETNDGAGGRWLTASSPNVQNLSNSIPFCALGNLIKFSFRDMQFSTNAFSVFTNDNSVYLNTGGQSFLLPGTNISPFITFYTNLPYGTPVPWLISHGFPSNFVAAEVTDPDLDGVPTWQEYLANTDPRDANSRFMVRTLAQALDGRYEVTFNTSTNRTYQVDTSTNLVNWQILQDNIIGTGANATVTDTRYMPGVSPVFYRVLVY